MVTQMVTKIIREKRAKVAGPGMQTSCGSWIEAVVCVISPNDAQLTQNIISKRLPWPFTLNITGTRCIITQDMASKMEVDPVIFLEVDKFPMEDESQSDSEDEDPNPNGFRIDEPLQPPQTTLFTMQILHSMLRFIIIFYWRLYECKF